MQEVPMQTKILSVQVNSQTTLDDVPVLVDAVLTLAFPVALRVAHASLSETIATSMLAALLYDEADMRERLCAGIDRRSGARHTPVREARIVRVCVPPHLRAYNDACLLAALADIRVRRRGSRNTPAA